MNYDKPIQSQRVQRRVYRMLPGVGIVPPLNKARIPVGVVAPNNSTHMDAAPAGVSSGQQFNMGSTPQGVVATPHPVHASGTPPAFVASDAGAKLNTYGDAPAGTAFVNFGGPIIPNVDVQLVFWGREWGNAPSVSPNDIQNRVDSILTGPYMSKLTQYGCSGKGRIRGTTFVTDQDPPNPFNDGSVQSFVSGLIDDETLPEPDEDWDLLVCVFMPTYANYGPGGASGAHSAVVGATMTCSMWTTTTFDLHGSETLEEQVPLMRLQRLSPMNLLRLVPILRPLPIQGGDRRLAITPINARSGTSATPLPGLTECRYRLTGHRLTTRALSPTLILAIGLAFMIIGVPWEDSFPRAHPSQLYLGVLASLTSLYVAMTAASIPRGGTRGKTGRESTMTGAQLVASSRWGHRSRRQPAPQTIWTCSSVAMTAASIPRGGQGNDSVNYLTCLHGYWSDGMEL